MVKPDLCDCSLKLYDYIKVKYNVRNLVKFNLIKQLKQILTKKKKYLNQSALSSTNAKINFGENKRPKSLSINIIRTL